MVVATPAYRFSYKTALLRLSIADFRLLKAMLQGYRTSFMLNETEHENSIANKNYNAKNEISFFKPQILHLSSL